VRLQRRWRRSLESSELSAPGKPHCKMFRNQYDTDVTTWSPAGRIHQIEYAMEAVKQGSAAVGLKSNTHVVLATLKRATSELSSFQKKVRRRWERSSKQPHHGSPYVHAFPMRLLIVSNILSHSIPLAGVCDFSGLAFASSWSQPLPWPHTPSKLHFSESLALFPVRQFLADLEFLRLYLCGIVSRLLSHTPSPSPPHTHTH